MKLNEFTAVGIRLLGILLFAKTLRDVPALANSIGWIVDPINGTAGNNISLMYFGIMILLLLLASFMIALPVTLANTMVPKSTKESPLIEENGDAIQIAGLTLIGVYILTWAIPDLINNGVLYFISKDSYPSDQQYLTELLVAEFVTIIEIGIGLYCILGSKGIIKIIKALRR